MSNFTVPNAAPLSQDLSDNYNPRIRICYNDLWRGKPPKDQHAPGEYRWKHVETTPYQAMMALAKGYAITAALGEKTHTSKSGMSTGIHRHTSNFAALCLAGVDFDEGTSFEDVLDYPLARNCGSFLYATASHTPEKPRTRLMFCLETPITDPDRAAELQQALIHHFDGEQPDKGVHDCVRVWYGAKPGNPVLFIAEMLSDSTVDEQIAKYRAANGGRVKAAQQTTSDAAVDADPATIAKARAWLARLKPERADDYDEWIAVGQALKHGLGPAGLPLWIGFSEQSGKFEAGVCEEKWETFSGAGRTLGTLMLMAEEDTPTVHAGAAETGQIGDEDQTQPPPTGQKMVDALNHFRADDEGHADALELLFPHRFLTVEGWGWLAWTGTHWSREDGEHLLWRAVVDTLIQRLKAAAEMRRTASKEEEKIADAIATASKPNAGRVKAVITALGARLVAKTIDFNNVPYLLNAANGIVDLRTKTLLPHDSAQRMTYCLDTAYRPDANDTPWRAFLMAAIEGGADVLEVVQTSMGYWITGETAEEKVWYLHGEARAGKGATLETLQAVLGDYLFGTAQFNTFTKERAGDDQGFDLAGFHACRIVFAEESNRNDYINPGRIKAWTGGGTIKCSFKHKDQFTYRVHWKGVLASNYPLNTDATDDALWSRVQIWHYPNGHVGAEDLLLKERMRAPAYLEGVLRFVVDGAARWYELRPKGGISTITPAAMTTHKDARRDELDLVGRWLEENCVLMPGLWTPSDDLYRDFAQFCKDNGQHAYANVTWGKQLSGRGHQKERRMHQRLQRNGYTGIGLIAPPPTGPADAKQPAKGRKP